MDDALSGEVQPTASEDPKKEAHVMKRAASAVSTRPRSIDELDTDLLAILEERDRRLYAILSKTTRYRNILGSEIKRLRAGSAPEVVRALIGQWDHLRREIKRLGQDL